MLGCQLCGPHSSCNMSESVGGSEAGKGVGRQAN